MAKNHMLRVRLTSEEYADLREAAAMRGLSVSGYVLRILFYGRYELSRQAPFVGLNHATKHINQAANRLTCEAGKELPVQNRQARTRRSRR
jgi:hypothetical protein